jgi:hypothetical protein
MVAERMVGCIFDNISCGGPLVWYRYFWNGVLLALCVCVCVCVLLIVLRLVCCCVSC